MHRNVIVMGASAGGVEALSEAVSGLPHDLGAAAFVVLHLPSTADSVLPALLQRHTKLKVGTAVDGEDIVPGRIYVAPPDHHLLVRSATVHLARGPKENGHRPAVDALFRSAARTCGARAVGVVLSGSLDDGASGLKLIALHGGVGVVQDPRDAAFDSMPLNALDAVPDAIRAPARELGAIIGELCRSPIQAEGMVAMEEDAALDVEDGNGEVWQEEPSAPPSVFTCPECHGTLFRLQDEDVERFQCRVGHAFSPGSLLAGQSEALEAALWTALRALQERTDLMRRMMERARKQGQSSAAERFEERVLDGDRNARLLRQVLLSGETARNEVG